MGFIIIASILIINSYFSDSYENFYNTENDETDFKLTLLVVSVRDLCNLPFFSFLSVFMLEALIKPEKTFRILIHLCIFCLFVAF